MSEGLAASLKDGSELIWLAFSQNSKEWIGADELLKALGPTSQCKELRISLDGYLDTVLATDAAFFSSFVVAIECLKSLKRISFILSPFSSQNRTAYHLRPIVDLLENLGSRLEVLTMSGNFRCSEGEYDDFLSVMGNLLCVLRLNLYHACFFVENNNEHLLMRHNTIVPSISKLPKLTELHLYTIAPSSTDLVVKGMKLSSISLTLFQPHASQSDKDRITALLAAALVDNTTLESLSINLPKLCDFDPFLVAAANSLGEKNPATKLKRLDLYNNPRDWSSDCVDINGALKALTKALKSNVILQNLGFSVVGGCATRRLAWQKVRMYLFLNRQGRQEVEGKGVSTVSFAKWMDTLAAVSGSVDCLFYYLLNYPTLVPHARNPCDSCGCKRKRENDRD